MTLADASAAFQTVTLCVIAYVAGGLTWGILMAWLKRKKGE